MMLVNFIEPGQRDTVLLLQFQDKYLAYSPFPVSVTYK
jgi:hypothetical protein